MCFKAFIFIRLMAELYEYDSSLLLIDVLNLINRSSINSLEL